MATPIHAVPDEVFAPRAQSSTDSQHQNGQPSSVDKLVGVLDEIDKAGWLDILTAVVAERDSLLDILVDEAGKPGSVQGVKSLIGLGQLITSLNPNAVSAIGHGLANGMNELDGGHPVPVRGIWDVLKASRDPDISRAFSVVLTLLKAVGEQLRPTNE